MTKLRAWNCLLALILVLLISVGLMASPAKPINAQGTWTIETVDDADVWNTSLALDSDDNPHISYSTFDPNSLRYARRTVAGWVKETVDTNPTLTSSLALDSGDQPHIGYSIASPSWVLEYASLENGAWTTEPVLPPGPIFVFDCSLALDSGSQPHMTSTVLVIEPDLLFALLYTYRTDEGWQITDPISDSGIYSSLALDRNDRPHVSYSNGNLMYAQFIGEGWATELVDPDNPEVVATSLVLDSNERPNIAYATLDTPGSLHYARWTGSSWALQTVDPAPEVWDCSLALDSQDHPHICYLVLSETAGTETAAIKYAEWTGTAWDIQTVAQDITPLGGVPMKTFNQEKMDILQQKAEELNVQLPATAGQIPFTTKFCSIALDSNDLPHISYGSLLLAAATSSLHYAHLVMPRIIAPSLPGPKSVSPQTPLPRLLSPANISVQFLSINPKQAAANQPVTISTNVVNTGDEAGNYNIALKVNGDVVETRMVSVGPQATQPIKFTVAEAQPGKYNIAILDKSGSFSVRGTSGDTGSKTGALVAVALVGVLIITTLVVLLLRRA